MESETKSNLSEFDGRSNTDSALIHGSFGTASGAVAYYMMKPKELRENHPVWHYFYLCALIFVAFISLFIGPVIFGMLAAIGGLATPFVLSLVGGGMGIIFGMVFGLIFSVICIVFLVKALGQVAEWVLNTLVDGGQDYWVVTKRQILSFLKHPSSVYQY